MSDDPLRGVGERATFQLRSDPMPVQREEAWAALTEVMGLDGDRITQTVGSLSDPGDTLCRWRGYLPSFTLTLFCQPDGEGASAFTWFASITHWGTEVALAFAYASSARQALEDLAPSLRARRLELRTLERRIKRSVKRRSSP